MIADPNLAFTTLIAGILGIYAGLCGRILLGVAGGVLAILGLASLAAKPIWWFGVVLLVLGVASFLFRSKFGGAFGVAAMTIGATQLIDSPSGIKLWLAILICVPFGAITMFLFETAARARANKSA